MVCAILGRRVAGFSRDAIARVTSAIAWNCAARRSLIVLAASSARLRSDNSAVLSETRSSSPARSSRSAANVVSA